MSSGSQEASQVVPEVELDKDTEEFIAAIKKDYEDEVEGFWGIDLSSLSPEQRVVMDSFHDSLRRGLIPT